LTEQLAVPTVGPGDRPHWKYGVKLPALSLAKVTVPVGVVGLEEKSVTIAVHVVAAATLTEPGLQEMDVVVEWAAPGVVTKRVNLPLEITT
jgi:hypothetical protein